MLDKLFRTLQSRAIANVFIGTLLFSFGCGNLAGTSSSVGLTPTPDHIQRLYESPGGNELSVTLQELGKLRLLVTVKNLSERDVYIAYLPGIGSDRTSFAVIGLEKLDPRVNGFVSVESSDFDPGWTALGPGKMFTYDLRVLQPGIYRSSLQYFVDTGFKKRIDANYDLFYSDPNRWRVDIEEINALRQHAVRHAVSESIAL